MATNIRQKIPYPAFLDGQTKRMLIGNQWVNSASGKTFESINPATGEVLATVAEGDAEDINRAVAAARQAFEGPWSKFKPYERQMLLLKLADLVEQHFDEFSRLDTLGMEFILRFTFSHPEMDTNIVGTINPAHLQDNVRALLQGPLPQPLYVEAKRRLELVG
jgi:Aldehyde dehydrogenase family